MAINANSHEPGRSRTPVDEGQSRSMVLNERNGMHPNRKLFRLSKDQEDKLTAVAKQNQKMKVKGVKALAARVRSSVRPLRLAEGTVSNNADSTNRGSSHSNLLTPKNDLSFDPFDERIDEIVAAAKNGEFDFLDPINSSRALSPSFESIFSHQMMVEFGTDNGVFLIERFNAGKVSPRMKKQIEAIREYTAGVFRRKYLAENSKVLDMVAELYRKAYQLGGLEQVDKAIASVNQRLRLNGSRFGIGPGTACMEGDNGSTEWIAVIFSDLDLEEFVALEWCHLQYHPVL